MEKVLTDWATGAAKTAEATREAAGSSSTRGRATSTLQALLAKLIVYSPLVFVAEDFEGFGNLREIME